MQAASGLNIASRNPSRTVMALAVMSNSHPPGVVKCAGNAPGGVPAILAGGLPLAPLVGLAARLAGYSAAFLTFLACFMASLPSWLGGEAFDRFEDVGDLLGALAE